MPLTILKKQKLLILLYQHHTEIIQLKETFTYNKSQVINGQLAKRQASLSYFM